MNIKKIRPMFTRIVTTMNRYSEDQLVGAIVDTSKTAGTMKEYQTVIAVGQNSAGIKEGDVVMIDPTRYAVMKHNAGSLRNGVIEDNAVVGYKIPQIVMNGQTYLLIDVADVQYVIEEADYPEESIENKAAKAGIYIPSNSLN